MGYVSGTAEVGEDLTPICSVPDTGARIRNNGGSTVYLGGPDLPSGSTGYPVEPGTAELIQGVKPKETAVIPAPPGDMDLAVLYGRTAPGAGISQVSFITVDLS